MTRGAGGLGRWWSMPRHLALLSWPGAKLQIRCVPNEACYVIEVGGRSRIELVYSNRSPPDYSVVGRVLQGDVLVAKAMPARYATQDIRLVVRGDASA